MAGLSRSRIWSGVHWLKEQRRRSNGDGGNSTGCQSRSVARQSCTFKTPSGRRVQKRSLSPAWLVVCARRRLTVPWCSVELNRPGYRAAKRGSKQVIRASIPPTLYALMLIDEALVNMTRSWTLVEINLPFTPRHVLEPAVCSKSCSDQGMRSYGGSLSGASLKP